MKDEYGNSIYFNKDGRVRIYLKDSKRTISYPRHLVEQSIGRELLPEEDIHHKDKNPLNNDISNLEIRFRGEHQAEHSRKYYDTTAVCGWCGKEFTWTGIQQQRFYSERRTGRHASDLPFCSRECSGKYGRMIQERSGHEGSTRRKLTSDQVKYIRENYIPRDKVYGCRAFSRLFNVDKTVIDGILKEKTYRDV